MTLPIRVVREGKERRRQWAQKLTPRPSKAKESSQDISGTETQPESNGGSGLLPDDIVQMLAAREKYDLFLSVNVSLCDCLDKASNMTNML